MTAWLAFLALLGVALAPELDGGDAAPTEWARYDVEQQRLAELPLVDARDLGPVLRALEGSDAQADAMLETRREVALPRRAALAEAAAPIVDADMDVASFKGFRCAAAAG